MKQRFSALDVRATVSDLKERIVGLRLQNVYDINPKTYLFKFSKVSRYFFIKLRKHIRTRRLTNVRQLGVDRIVDFEFAGFGEGTTYHIIAEFYASGNIIFTDQDYTILALLRVVQPKENEKMAVGQTYDVSSVARVTEPVTRSRLQKALTTSSSKESKESLKKVLNNKLSYGQALTEHAIRFAQIDPNMKVGTIDISDDSEHLIELEKGFKEADRILEEIGNTKQKGYIIMLHHSEQNSTTDDGSQQEDWETYDEFNPYLFEQHKSKSHKEFDSFDLAVDEYYSSMESQKLTLKQRNQEKSALKKLEAIKKEQYSRVENLQNSQLSNIRKAWLIESNVDTVDQAILIIRNAIASGMDWKDLENLVLEEKKKGTPIAEVIAGFKLEINQITLLLREHEKDEAAFYDSANTEPEDENNISQSIIQEKIDVDINLTAFANARKYYDMKKQSSLKQEKTLAAADKAFKSAEQKIKQDLKETKITASINKIRKPFWFEKFVWFISSENYLVIAGHDMQQNELLVKRYLRKGDVYVHAELHGAASVIIKNPNEGQPIPPSTLFQAGVMSVCQSKAWEAKIITSAYWVHAEQVSKTAPTGEYLTTGSFMIRGKKNFLPPVHLVYGFGLLFRLDEQSIPNHLHERRPIRNEEEIEEEIQASEVSQEKKDDVMEFRSDIIYHKVSGVSPELEEVQEPQQQRSDESNDDMSSEKVRSAITMDKSLWDKYNLDEYGEDQYEIEGSYEKPTTKKKYISVKEKRTMKKQKQGKGDTDSGRIDNNQQINKNKDTNIEDKEKQAKKSTQIPRGKKGKMKKLKDKYADQDEEERAIRMELLGSNKAPKNKGKKGKKESTNKGVPNSVKGNKPEKEQNFQNNLSQDPEADKEDIDEEKLASGVKDEEEAEEIRQLLKEENITVLEPETMESLTVLDTLTGSPLPEDNLLFAVPVCAPYISLQKYKYKVKLTPGSTKKGKACKTAISFFLNDPQLTPREKELVKSIPDTEMTLVMLGKCKVSAPNIEQFKKIAKKAAKKEASKEAAKLDVLDT
ncbi:fibronectin-binding protein A N-terminus-domain-containing protein [Rhizophagus diaphanus]|nr:fibronectin-binding protein A N-terminus-domain-containing protein [Rhizophagus diaphanus] [Rhizophagus sp. MUCL 43196]